MSKRNSIGSAPDNFLPPFDWPWISEVMQGKTRSFPALRAGERTGVFLIAGQSLAAGASEGLYSPSNASFVDNLSQFDGQMLRASDPLIGQAVAALPSQRASPFTRVADKLISWGAFDRVVLIPVAIGGTTIAQWNSIYISWLINGYRRAAALGFSVTAVLWQLGETDTAIGTTQQAYAQGLASLISKLRVNGCMAPWVLAKSTYIPGGTTSPGIRAAIEGLVNGNDILAGPDCDTLPGTAYRYDDQHWNAVGNEAAANLWHAAIRAGLS